MNRREIPFGLASQYEDLLPAADITGTTPHQTSRTPAAAGLHDAIAQLTPRQQAVLARWLDGQNEYEIARATGLTRATVQDYLRRSFTRLRRLLEQGEAGAPARPA